VFALAGYGFSTVAKTLLLFSSSVLGLSAFRIIERLGKGFRGPPRDAWLSAIAGSEKRGYAFGVHKALDKTGAIFGPLIAYGLLAWLGDGASTYQILFWVAMVPAVLSIVALSLVKDQPAPISQRESLFETWKILSPQFKRFLVSAGIFSLAYFSFGFLLLRAYSVGFTIKNVVLLYALFNITCVIAAPLIGKISDRVGRSRMIKLSYLTYLALSLGFAYVTTQWQIIALFAVYGVFYAIDEAQNKAFIADLELERRASAIGMYNFITGILYLPASLIAGGLWLVNPSVPFFVAASFALLAIIAFQILRPGIDKGVM
jgi:MFS family permease